MTKEPTCGELLELATPHLYRRNLFRVLGLSISATPADVRREQKKLEMRRKLGMTGNDGGGGPFVLIPHPGENDLRGALDRLNDPSSRILDEVFWFWPVNGDLRSDAALKSLGLGDVRKAASLWEKETGPQKERRETAAHNLAVLGHLDVLDKEFRLQSGESVPETVETLSKQWTRVFSLWRRVIDGEAFWGSLKDRVRELDDVRLTTGLVRRIHETLPKALLSINARLAFDAAEHGDVEWAKRHVKLIREAGFPEGLADEVLRETLTSIRSRIKAMCDAAESVRDKDVEHANTAALKLLEDARPLLQIVDVLLAEDDPVRHGLHDDVASNALNCQIGYGNKTENWHESLSLIEAILPVAVGAAMRERIERNLEIVRRNKELGTCHFCGVNPCDKSVEIAVDMYGDVVNLRYKITWRTLTVKVPRCLKCKEKHKEWKKNGLLIGLGSCSLAFLIIFFNVLFLSRSHQINDAVAAGICGSVYLGPVIWIISWLIGKKIFFKRHGIKSQTDLNTYSAIKERLAKGWEKGKKPATN